MERQGSQYTIPSRINWYLSDSSLAWVIPNRENKQIALAIKIMVDFPISLPPFFSQNIYIFGLSLFLSAGCKIEVRKHLSLFVKVSNLQSWRNALYIFLLFWQLFLLGCYLIVVVLWWGVCFHWKIKRHSSYFNSCSLIFVSQYISLIHT